MDHQNWLSRAQIVSSTDERQSAVCACGWELQVADVDDDEETGGGWLSAMSENED